MTAGPEVNIPLLRKAVEWAEAEAAKPPDICEWEQDHWVVAVSEDDRKAWMAGRVTADLGKADECGTCYCIAGYAVASTLGPIPVPHVDRQAQLSLGLTDEQAEALFDGDNDIDDVRRIAEDIAGERL